ncbi:Uncharacterized protein SCF082_LOCUS24472, partial [Durusdinium trenchii]
METMVQRWHQKEKQKLVTTSWVTKNWLMQERHWTKSMCDHAFEWAKQKGLWQINPIHKEEEDPNGDFISAELACDGVFLTAWPESLMLGSGRRMATTLRSHLDKLLEKYNTLSDLQGTSLSNSLDEKNEEMKKEMAEITKIDVAMNNLMVRARNVRAPMSAGRDLDADKKEKTKVKVMALGLILPMNYWLDLKRGHSYSTRWLSTCISSKVMVDQTWEDINKVLADDLYELYFDGVNIGKHCFRFAYVGLKGDWRGGNLVVTVNCIVGLANLMTHGSRVSQRRFGRFLAQTVLCGSGQTWLIAGLLALEKTLRKDWQLQLDAGARYVLNYVATSCWSDEDFVGR